MLYCTRGEHLTAPGVRCIKYVVSKRQKTYTEKHLDSAGNTSFETTIGTGWEIEKEGLACPDHASVS